MTDQDLEKFLNDCDEKTKQGTGQSIIKPLKSIYDTVKNISNKNRIKYCNLLYRNGQVNLASKVIYRLATAQPREDLQSLAEIEYAKSLLLLGKHSESKRILQSIDFKKFPLAQYQLGFCYSLQWNFAEAIQQTDEFLKISTENHYFNTLAQLNNLIDVAYLDSSRLNVDEIQNILSDIKRNNYTLLQAVGTQVYGRYFLHKKNYAKASRIFTEGLNLIKNIGSFDRHYLQKWRLVAEFHKSKDRTSVKKEFVKLRQQALRTQDDTTARECDFYLGNYYKDLKTARFCYAGTPFPAFKKWVLDNGIFTESELQMPDLMISVDGISPTTRLFKKELDVSHLPTTVLKTFVALTRDFYNPLTLPRLHEQVFPELFWNPFSSPVQMRQLIFRLRQDLNLVDKKVSVLESNQTYRLAFLNPKKVLQIKTQNLTVDSSTLALGRLSIKFKNDSFTFADFQKLIGCPRRSAQRSLAALVTAGHVKSVGKTRQTKYYVTKK